MMRPVLRTATLILLGVLVPTGSGVLGAPATRDPERRTPVVLAVEKAAPAVVNISTTKLVQVADPWFEDFFGRYAHTRKVRSVGSGVIVHPDGYVVTNSHVVRRATEIVVGLGESGKERTLKGTLLADDPRNDLALVKINASRPLPFVELGESDDLMIGEPAIAVGNPFAVGKTVTTGVISALGRTVRLENGTSFEDFIQTDAAINPGNSGGPLLNIHGKMIGVNTAIVRGGEGIGFAIPVDRVKANLGKLVDAAVARAHLGFTPVAGKGGVHVEAVDPKGAADKAGLKAGDLIERVESRAVHSVFDFATPILGKKPGDHILVTISRGGERQRVDLLVPAPPLSPAAKYVLSRLGVVPRAPSAKERAEGLSGVIVGRVVRKGPADRIGVEPGDVIVAVQDPLGRNRLYSIGSVDTLASLLQRAASGATLDIDVSRNGRTMTGSVTLR